MKPSPILKHRLPFPPIPLPKLGLRSFFLSQASDPILARATTESRQMVPTIAERQK